MAFNLFIDGGMPADHISLHTHGKEYAYNEYPLKLEVFHELIGVSGEMPLRLEAFETEDDIIGWIPSWLRLRTKSSIKSNAEIVDEGGESIFGITLFLRSSQANEYNALQLFVNVDTPSQSDSFPLYLSQQDVGANPVNSGSMSLVALNVRPPTPVEIFQGGLMSFIMPVISDSARLSHNSSMSLNIHNYIPSTEINNSIPLYITDSNTVKWDAENFGSNIAPDDDVYATIPATDPIRGFNLICYGNCANGTCQVVSVETHDTSWFEPLCVDGGIFRPDNVYTNPDQNFYGTDIPYSGHFYGIRKLTGLHPSSRYLVTVTGRSGSSISIASPKQLTNWEYTVDGSDVGYSGTKLIGDYPYLQGIRNEGDRYGTSVDMNQDLLAVGSPYVEIDYDYRVLDNDVIPYTLHDTGTVFLYRRGPEPDFSQIVENKAPWNFEANLQLPSGITRDWYTDSESSVNGVPVTIRTWKLGQEGRHFGKDVHISITKNEDPWVLSDQKELVAVSAPYASWSRTFVDPSVRNNEILLIVFTDEFSPTIGDLSYRDIIDSVISKNLFYQYYSDPTISLSVKIVIFQPMDLDLQQNVDFPPVQPAFIIKRPINRHRNEPINSTEFSDIDDLILDQIKDVYHELYPNGGGAQPALLGVYVDNSRSLGTRAIEPALSRFKTYYQEQTFNNGNGITEHDGVPASGAVLSITSLDENWIAQTKNLIDHTLDSERLADEDYLKLLTDPVTFGQFNQNLNEFNIPPSSGGCVYLFEKEGGDWNLIQSINSPTNDNSISPDLFGTSIDISEDGTILAIGSPYINEAVMLYQLDPQEKDRMYSNIENWIDYHLEEQPFDNYFNTLKDTILDMRKTEEFADDDAGIFRNVFLNFSHQEKYDYRNDQQFWVNHLSSETISDYKPLFTYKYSDIPYGGTYKRLVEEFAPTSRMGYSIAVSDDGNSVAVGCPTDSLNETDDTNAYYHPTNSDQILWPSYVNAGAVRVINSRKYTEHDSVVEYNRFGNKYESLNYAQNPDQFNHFSDVYSEIDKNYIKQSYDTFTIPDNAGVVYIMCPEVDYSNVNVMNSIKRWLDLGDRNLVLVGNDSRTESIGKFRRSNQIINNILSKLDSSMRLDGEEHPPTALISGGGLCTSKPNVITATRPVNSIDSYIDSTSPLYGYGVARIVMSASDVEENYSCSQTYKNSNKYCSPPLIDGGDLRAEWKDEEGIHNWPQIFSDLYGEEKRPPVPLMTAAYYKDPISIVIPEIPASSGLYTFYEWVFSQFHPEFGSATSIHAPPVFEWSSDADNYISLDLNAGNVSNIIRLDPERKMGVDPVLQYRSSDGVDTVVGSIEVERPCHFAAEEIIPDPNNNTLALISSLYMETVDVLYSGFGDKDINFYSNLVAKDVNGSAYIAQINSFSGRTHFTDAKPNSILSLVLSNTGNTVSTNVSLSNLITGHSSGRKYDVCWIANPLNIPSQQDIDQIKKWLTQKNKRIIVTYDNDISAKSAEILCEALGLTMTPLYLPNKARYANNFTDISENDRFFYSNSNGLYYPRVNDNNTRIRYGFLPSRDAIRELGIDVRDHRFIPIELNNALPIASLVHGISDSQLVDTGFFYTKSGMVKLTVPVEPNTAYKVFFDTVIFSKLEREPLNIHITNCNLIPSFTSPDVPPSQNINQLTDDFTFESVFFGPVGVINYIGGDKQEDFVETESFNFQTLDGVNEVSIFIDANNSRVDTDSNTLPSTVGLLAVSGCKLNIDSVAGFTREPRYEWRITQEAQPARSATIEFPNPLPITSNSSKYCPDDQCVELFGDIQVEDGPVVVAQEIYNTSSDQGIDKSRITLISDVGLVEGPCVFDAEGEIQSSHLSFLQSLYPNTVFPNVKSSKLFDIDKVNKIVAPERTSPARLFSYIGNSGLIERFLPDNTNIVNSGLSLSEFRDSVDSDDIDRPELVESDFNTLRSDFQNSQIYYGSNSKFNYSIDGINHQDVSILGGKPSVMDMYGSDFIDSDAFPSGYPGDLFGYSVDYHRGRLVIGSPFAAHHSSTIISWDEVVSESDPDPNIGTIFGITASRNGGAGSVYVYESGVNKQLNLVQKLRPKSIGVGQDLDDTVDSTLTEYLGQNNYSLDDLLNYSTFTDQFGYSVKIYSDIIAVGAPGHDYSINADLADAILASGAYEFKSFNFEFDAKPRTLIDLGDPDVREAIGLISGVMNNGAVYTFENKIINQTTNDRSWTLVEKLIPDGYNARLQKGYDEVEQVVASGTENEHFGETLALYRPKRTDADYSIAIGSPHHKFAVSETHQSGDLENAGAVFLFDAMLRSSPPYVPDNSTHIHASVFGTKNSKVNLNIDNSQFDKMYQQYGIITSNPDGEIFIEASGQDPNIAGFSVHRPYITSVYGREYIDPDAVGMSDTLTLYTQSVNGISSNDIALFCYGADIANVYNTMSLHLDTYNNFNDELVMYLHGSEGVTDTGWIGLFTSGNPDNFSQNLNLFTSGY